jgi:hypothetical protein
LLPLDFPDVGVKTRDFLLGVRLQYAENTNISFNAVRMLALVVLKSLQYFTNWMFWGRSSLYPEIVRHLTTDPKPF